jgi:predicted amidohydrolase YtcJ
LSNGPLARDFPHLRPPRGQLDLRLHDVGDHHKGHPRSSGYRAEIPLRGGAGDRARQTDHARQVARIQRLGLTTISIYDLEDSAALTRDIMISTARPAHRPAEAVAVSAGTDNIPYNPFVTLQTIVERKERKSGSVLGPAQRLDVLRALRLMTSEAGWISFEEDRKGTLAPGKFADLAVWYNRCRHRPRT